MRNILLNYQDDTEKKNKKERKYLLYSIVSTVFKVIHTSTESFFFTKDRPQ